MKLKKKLFPKYFSLLILFFIFIQVKSYEIETIITYLSNKSIDNIRQILWSTILYANTIEKSTTSFLPLKNTLHSLNRLQIAEKIYKIFFSLPNIDSELIDLDKIEQKSFFNIETSEDIDNLISKEDLPKNFLINLAINIDKFERTENMAINSLSEYVNFLTREKIINYIKQKLNEYPLLKEKENFNNIVLNKKPFIYTDINNYISTKTNKELIQLIYGCENYSFNQNSNDEDDTVIAYNLYSHTELDTYERNDYILFISTYNKKIAIKDLDEYILLIEDRNFTYLNNEDFLKEFSKEELTDSLIAFEKYYKRQTNTTKSLKGLKEYIDTMNDETKKEVLQWGLSLFPELYEKGRFQDIISNEYNLQYGQVKQFVKVTQRDILLKYAYNIHTYQNKIESIYNASIYDFYRYKTDSLYELILKDTNANKELQEKNIFTNYATLHEDDFVSYVHNLPRNQLKLIVTYLIEMFFKVKTVEYNSIRKPSEKKIKIDSAANLDTPQLLETAENYISSLNIVSTQKFFNDPDVESIIKDKFHYMNNIIDFLRSTNINYLRLWLRKYELNIRKLKSVRYVEGGLKSNFMNINEYNKKELIDIFDIYIAEYPDLFTPENFIKLVGLDSGKTPHKFLVELSKGKDYKTFNEVFEIALSLTGHFQRKNIQTSFNIRNYLSYLTYLSFISAHDVNYNQYLFQMFRLINLFPELNNIDLFKKICVFNETKVINTFKEDYLTEYYFKYRNIKQIANNIQYFYNHLYEAKYQDINNMKLSELKDYILNFVDLPNIMDNEELKGRVLDGDFYPIFYDNNEGYLNSIKKNVIIDNIYSRMEKICLNQNKYQIKNATTIEDKKKIIIETVNTFEEFQTPHFFDYSFDFIDLKSEGYDVEESSQNSKQILSLFEFLNNSNNKNLLYYTLITNIVKIEYEKKAAFASSPPDDIYLKIHYMSRNQMIRYILDIVSINNDLMKKINPNSLRILVKKYMIDLGSDNIYDLTTY